MTIYLDNMAATPIDPRVVERHQAAMRDYPGNAHSGEHQSGSKAKRAIDQATEVLLSSLESDSEHATFTPGASAALWLAVQDALSRVNGRPARIAATAIEHPSLLANLKQADGAGQLELTILPVDQYGHPVIENVKAALEDGLDLLCTMAANNEVGTLSDIAMLADLASRSGARHLVDASQAAGRIEMSAVAAADLVVVSGAKMYGPRRSGALIGTLSARAAQIAHDVFGSPDTPSAVALAYALALRRDEREADEKRISAMRDKLQAHLVANVPGLLVNGDLTSRLAGSLHVSTPHLPGDEVLARLWARVDVSTGAACQSGAQGPSHVLSAMDIPHWAREGAVRIGVGRFNTPEDIEGAGKLIAAALRADEPARRSA